ncbi:cytochrome c oxidase assembly protein [Dietzia sp. PP-33]|uniref:cytochrome c oxidase assembly protein n=1 Tax=Dietzia sp. PP-33 TaxID=2957500 RepID=UPI0029B82E65|nr:cytochrome c oxidase assembly protein [Dietzia sp. PP-33]MDX2358323.1 cytochrome c oxidase assembly protein [Dietzia sp. PP-33]
MRPDHAQHGTTAWWIPESVVAALLGLSLALYLVGVHRHRTRGPWPLHRTAMWIGGLVCLTVSLIGPLAAAARHDFTAHMAGHLLLGMLGPLLLVLAAPVTLTLRTLRPAHARLVSTALRSTVARVLTHPVVAGVLNAGGLWLLYTTELYEIMHHSLPVHVAVHMHVFLAGVVFTVAIVGPDPNPHRAGFRTRAAVLVLFIAAHSVLGRWLYGHPPAGVDAAAARAGAQLMFYGGEVLDLALLVLLFSGWYPTPDRRSRLLPRNPSRARSSAPTHVRKPREEKTS